jgi:hypothetical protein
MFDSPIADSHRLQSMDDIEQVVRSSSREQFISASFHVEGKGERILVFPAGDYLYLQALPQLSRMHEELSAITKSTDPEHHTFNAPYEG